MPFDILPGLPRPAASVEAGDSPKRSSRLHISSGAKYAFASSRHRLPPDCDRRCAFQRVQPCQSGLPSRTRRVWFERALLSRHHERRGASFERLRQDGIPFHPSTAGYSARTVPPFASDPWAGTWRSGSESTPDLLPREKSRRSRGAVEDGVSRRGNSGNAVYGGLWPSSLCACPLPYCAACPLRGLHCSLRVGALPCLSGNPITLLPIRVS